LDATFRGQTKFSLLFNLERNKGLHRNSSSQLYPAKNVFDFPLFNHLHFWPSQLRGEKSFHVNSTGLAKNYFMKKHQILSLLAERMEASGIPCTERKMMQLFSLQSWTLH